MKPNIGQSNKIISHYTFILTDMHFRDMATKSEWPELRQFKMPNSPAIAISR
jgi:hypothetical protein